MLRLTAEQSWVESMPVRPDSADGGMRSPLPAQVRPLDSASVANAVRMKGYIAFVTREHEPLLIASAAQGARACVGHVRGHLTAAKSDYLRERRFKSEAVQCACLGRIACRI